jgi:hypothetical protein
VRVEVVEAVFHRTSGFAPKYRSGTATIGATVAGLMGGGVRACEFRLSSESQIHAVAGQIADVFDEFALPYFEKWSSLEAIDAELNDEPAKQTIHRGAGWLRCSTGIIVAKLVGRPNYRQLAGFYHDVMAGVSKGFYLKRFEALLSSLDNIQAGSGLTGD